MEGLHDPRARADRAQGRDHRGQAAGRRSRHHRANEHAGLCRQRYQSQHRLRPHGKCLRCALQPRRLFRRHGYCGHGELRGPGQWNRYRQFDPDAGCHQLGGWRLPNARPGEYRRHRAAGLAARQHRAYRPQRDRCGHRAGRDGGGGSPGSPHRRLRCQGSARPLHRVPEDRRTQRETLRRTRFHSRGSRRSLPGHTGGGVCKLRRQPIGRPLASRCGRRRGRPS